MCPACAHPGDCWWYPEGTALVLGRVKGRVSLETVTREGCHRHTDLCCLPVSMQCERQRQGMLKLSLFFHPSRTPTCSNFLGMAACSLAHWAYLLAGSGGSALYVLRDRRCADRQRDFVVYEGELMGENILPHLGIQEALTGNQGIHGTQ